MKRLQIYIEESVDDRLGIEAARRGVSKAAVVREAVSAYLDEDGGTERDALDDLVGAIDADPIDDLDEVAYG